MGRIFSAALVVAFAVSCSHLVSLSTSPPVARVTVDGRDGGVTPLTFLDQHGGGRTYHLAFEKDGYVRKTVDLEQEWRSDCVAGSVVAGVMTGGLGLLGLTQCHGLTESAYVFPLTPAATASGTPNGNAVTATQDFPALETLPDTWRSVEGYQTTRWGMIRAEIKKLFPQAKPTEDVVNKGLYLSAKVGTFATTTVFSFVRDRLKLVSVAFTNGGDWEEQYRQLAIALEAKYNRAGEEKEEIGKHSRIWRLDRTAIILERDPFSTAMPLAVNYLSLELAKYEELVDPHLGDAL